MKYLKFAFMSIYDNIKMNLLMILEIVVIIIGLNIIVGSYNNRNMLIKPYSDILEKTGWYMANDRNVVNDEPILNDMKGDLVQIRIESYLDTMDNIPVRIKVVPDNIIDKMKLPVSSGKWKTSSKKETVCISAPNKYGVHAGDIIKTQNIDGVKVVGVLTDPCYIPDYTGWYSMGGIENFYLKYSSDYDASEQSNDLMLIMSESEFSETGLETNSSNFKFILYDNDPTSENTANNEQIIKDNYNAGVPLSSIKYRAELDVKNLFSKYIPIAVCAFIVILLGFISCTAINTLKQMKNYGTLFICGMNWKDCIKICMAYTAIIMLCSVCLSTSVLIICSVFNFSAVFGLSFDMNNIYVSAILIGIMFGMNLIIPIFIINRKTPVEIIREGNL